MVTKSLDFGLEVSRLLPRILREVTKEQMSIFSKGGLNLPYIVILEYLREKGASTMSELASILNLTMSAVTGIVDKMIDLKLVKRERCSDDRRIVRVIPLKKGEDLAVKIGEHRRNTANNIFSVLDEVERKEYLRLLKKVYDSLRVD